MIATAAPDRGHGPLEWDAPVSGGGIRIPPRGGGGRWGGVCWGGGGARGRGAGGGGRWGGGRGGGGWQDRVPVGWAGGAPPATHGRDTQEREGDAQRERVEKDPAEAEEQQQVDQDDRPDHEDQPMESLPISTKPAMRTSERRHRQPDQEQHP